MEWCLLGRYAQITTIHLDACIRSSKRHSIVMISTFSRPTIQGPYAGFPMKKAQDQLVHQQLQELHAFLGKGCRSRRAHTDRARCKSMKNPAFQTFFLSFRYTLLSSDDALLLPKQAKIHGKQDAATARGVSTRVDTWVSTLIESILTMFTVPVKNTANATRCRLQSIPKHKLAHPTVLQTKELHCTCEQRRKPPKKASTTTKVATHCSARHRQRNGRRAPASSKAAQARQAAFWFAQDGTWGWYRGWHSCFFYFIIILHSS
jgi:hypothetical protein